MASPCGHQLCDLIGGTCSLASTRSRGCRPNLTEKDTAPEVIDEVRDLLGAIAPAASDDAGRAAATRLAALVRREALDDRNLITAVADEDLALGQALAQLCARRR